MLTNTIPAAPHTPTPIQPRQVLSAAALTTLNQRSNRAGVLRFLGHLGVIVLGGYLWGSAPLWLALPALVACGAGLALMFCAMHESCHRTAFANPRLNDAAAWLTGLLSFYNSTFYRRYHKWHHRYTQIPGKDPELEDPKPTGLADYLWQLSGIPWWMGKLRCHGRVALGNLEGCYYIAASGQAEVIRSVRLQLLAYVGVLAVSTLLGHPWFLFTYWLLPLAVGQPLLRFVLLAEHTGCSNDDNPLINTRTTLTLWPLRWLMWNMPYHAEHHLYPSIPFQALPAAHEQLKPYFERVEAGYLRVNRGIVADFSQG
ncbi:fatty acid desaturase [Nodosilinea sp. PGN35]|uniref:fatty acid desaturase n=1 Tax=Nodosilinea sp. PGN35 TaxID=3020489 RepID=UPI0023B29533|nr:fatty acid desaturase [Nodosilinea sp. TSF1-S3]MDF0365840.1 fatty acid desaturase [Nodosilinea sp. TSF1-S3]